MDMVVRLAYKLRLRVAALTGERLQGDDSHKVALERWQSFRDHALKSIEGPAAARP